MGGKLVYVQRAFGAIRPEIWHDGAATTAGTHPIQTTNEYPISDDDMVLVESGKMTFDEVVEKYSKNYPVKVEDDG